MSPCSSACPSQRDIPPFPAPGAPRAPLPALPKPGASGIPGGALGAAGAGPGSPAGSPGLCGDAPVPVHATVCPSGILPALNAGSRRGLSHRVRSRGMFGKGRARGHPLAGCGDISSPLFPWDWGLCLGTGVHPERCWSIPILLWNEGSPRGLLGLSPALKSGIWRVSCALTNKLGIDRCRSILPSSVCSLGFGQEGLGFLKEKLSCA